jgi:glycosyltransferase involved in cell wall biosynthesis
VKPNPQLSLSIVVPCYNELEVLPALQTRLAAALEGLASQWEVLLVDDGSSDGTWEEMLRLHRCDPRFKAVRFSRNFGHQRAVSAGLTFTTGDVVAVMDADLQDPPELLAKCLEKIRAGYDVVFAVRRKRKESLLKRAAYSGFYRLLKTISDVNIPLDAGDFCVMSRRVVAALNTMRESNIFVRGLRAWVGFKQIGIEYERGERAAGKTKYSFWKLVRLANDGISHSRSCLCGSPPPLAS